MALIDTMTFDDLMAFENQHSISLGSVIGPLTPEHASPHGKGGKTPSGDSSLAAGENARNGKPAKSHRKRSAKLR